MKTYTAKEIAELLKGQLKGDENRTVSGVSSLKDANESQVSFLGNKKYHHQLAPSSAGVVLLSKDVENEELPDNKTYIICDNVDLAFSTVIGLFAPPAPVRMPPPAGEGRWTSAGSGPADGRTCRSSRPGPRPGCTRPPERPCR